LDSEREDIELRELFRNKLENAEIVPDPSVNSRLMKKLARQEFLTFNPARFNVYYLGGILVAGIVATLLLSTSDLNTSVQTPGSVADFKTVLEEKPAVSIKNEDAVITDKQTVNNKQVLSKSPEIKTDAQSPVSVQRDSESKSAEVVHAEPIPSVVANDLLKKDPDSDRLISSIKSSGNLFVSSVMEGCVPLKVRFICTATDIDSYRWTFGDGGESNEKTPEWIFDLDGEYKVTLEVFSGDRLAGTSTEIIKVRPRPVANFEISPEQAVIPDDVIRYINYSTDAVRYLWDFGDGSHSELFEPQHSYNKYGQYNVKLTAINEYGCSDSVLVLNAFAGSKYFIEFPNAFIPNPDGPSAGLYSSKSDEKAEVFHPVYTGVTEYQLRIFSKIGILIFESNDINIGWDGYINGQLSNTGVYIWKVRGKYRNGETFTKMGDVTLLKN
jgi:PKD repeat protein